MKDTEKPKNAQNMKVLREILGLSQSEMAVVLGGVPQGSYKMWELKTKTPTKIRDILFASGVNLNWFDTGEGEMLRPGIDRIQVVRDESTGKATGLRPVPSQTPVNIDRNATTQNAAGISSKDVANAWVMIHRCCVSVDIRPDLMPVEGTGRLLGIVARKLSEGLGAAAMAELEDEVKDLVGAMSGAAR